MNRKNKFRTWFGLLFVWFLFPATSVQGQIAKCQDADGKWHYGNFASEECAQSDVTHMDGSGNVLGRESRPLTDEELAEAKETAERDSALQAKLDLELAERARIADIYDTEEDIARARDNKLQTVEQQLATVDSLLVLRRNRLDQVSESLASARPEATGLIDRLTIEKDSLTSLILEYEAAIAEAELRKIEIESNYKRELMIYRDFN